MSRRRRHTSFAERWEGVEKREREKREREAFFFPLSGARFLPLAYSLIEQPDSAGSEETGGSPQFTARGVGWEERERGRDASERKRTKMTGWNGARVKGLGSSERSHMLYTERGTLLSAISARELEEFFSSLFAVYVRRLKTCEKSPFECLSTVKDACRRAVSFICSNSPAKRCWWKGVEEENKIFQLKLLCKHSSWHFLVFSIEWKYIWYFCIMKNRFRSESLKRILTFIDSIKLISFLTKRSWRRGLK